MIARCVPGERLSGFHTTVIVRSSQAPMEPGEARRFMSRLARRLDVRDRMVSVVFGEDSLLQGLNLKYRRVDQATDVLAFPSKVSGYLGDIVLSAEMLREHARHRHRCAEEEARVLLVHGFLHLLGYDHERDDGEMVVLERSLRWELSRGRAQAH